MSPTGQLIWRSLLSIVTLGNPPQQIEVSCARISGGNMEKLSGRPNETLWVLRKRHEHCDSPFVHLVQTKRRTHSSLTVPVFKVTGRPKNLVASTRTICTRPRALVKLKYSSLPNAQCRVEWAGFYQKTSPPCRTKKVFKNKPLTNCKTRVGILNHSRRASE